MARVQYKSTPGGVLQRRNGDAWEGVTIEHTGTAPYAEATGATPYGGPLTSDIDGAIPGWLDPGVYTTRNPLSGKQVTFEVGGGAGDIEPRVSSLESSRPLKANLPVNVKDHGAIGDGVADDTAAIIAAIEAARVKASGNALGARVFFPAGEYKVTGQIVVPYNVQLQGEGFGEYLNANGATTIKSTFNGKAVLVQANRYGWGIRDLNITGDLTLASQDLLTIGEGDNTLPAKMGKVERVYISRAGRDNLVVDDALQLNVDTVHSAYAKRYALRHEGQSNSNKFTKCRFAQSDQWGLRFIGGKATFDTCTFEANSRDAATAYGGAWFDPNDVDAAASIQVTLLGCHFETNNGPLGTGIPLQVSGGTRACVITEINSVYADTSTLQCVIAEGEFTSISVATNLTTHANCNGANSVVFLHPRTAIGAGNFAISDPGNIAILFGAAGVVGGTQPGGGIKIGDIKLFRHGAGRLRLDTARYEALRAAATDAVFSAFVSGNAIERLLVHASGKLHWSDGTTIDTTLERLAAGVLGVDAGDCFRTGKAATTSRPSASAVGSGSQFFDTSLNKPIWSDGTNWRDAAGTVV